MLQIVNATPFAVHRGILLSPEGGHLWTICIKGTYRLPDDGRVALHDQQELVTPSPKFLGTPGESTLLRENEFVCDHPGTAVTLNASAHAPGRKAVTQLEVGVSVGGLKHRLRVVGDRAWASGRLRRLVATAPQPFTSMPITWERAYGGVDRRTGTAHAANPIGRGWFTEPADAVGTALPNIEWPDAPTAQPGAAADPAGLCAVSASWSPRLELAGTADEAWATTRAPLWPQDWNPWHHNAAVRALQSPTKLRGGEEVVLTNLSPSADLRFRLPRLHFDLRTKFIDGRTVQGEVGLDRVIIEPDAQRLVMVWRSALDCGRDGRRVSSSWLDTKTDFRTGRKDGCEADRG
jgi:hypothetical protein